jgi:hypothetical protein
MYLGHAGTSRKIDGFASDSVRNPPVFIAPRVRAGNVMNRGHPNEWSRFPGNEGRSGEDADAARPHQETDDDQHDSPEELPPEESEDTGDHQDDCEDPKE